ncbi:MAG: hypothetical protein CL816_04650 [Coxiellaceae bacterium]|nr:hypothetical protein [Coxiellaceae bacterium]|tara:strand:- start:506 stop:2002 length:1497 start_codon:yes stop_codon:yes gene_type:complete
MPKLTEQQVIQNSALIQNAVTTIKDVNTKLNAVYISSPNIKQYNDDFISVTTARKSAYRAARALAEQEELSLNTTFVSAAESIDGVQSYLSSGPFTEPNEINSGVNQISLIDVIDTLKYRLVMAQAAMNTKKQTLETNFDVLDAEMKSIADRINSLTTRMTTAIELGSYDQARGYREQINTLKTQLEEKKAQKINLERTFNSDKTESEAFIGNIRKDIKTFEDKITQGQMALVESVDQAFSSFVGKDTISKSTAMGTKHFNGGFSGKSPAVVNDPHSEYTPFSKVVESYLPTATDNKTLTLLEMLVDQDSGCDLLWQEMPRHLLKSIAPKDKNHSDGVYSKMITGIDAVIKLNPDVQMLEHLSKVLEQYKHLIASRKFSFEALHSDSVSARDEHVSVIQSRIEDLKLRIESKNKDRSSLISTTSDVVSNGTSTKSVTSDPASDDVSDNTSTKSATSSWMSNMSLSSLYAAASSWGIFGKGDQNDNEAHAVGPDMNMGL